MRNRRVHSSPIIWTALLLCGSATHVTGEPATAWKELAADLAAFEQGARQYRETVDNLVRREYEARREQIMKDYGALIRREETEERKRRNATIVQFEKVLKQYAKHRRWAGDIIFRLAELHFEKSNDEYLLATEAYEEALRDPQRASSAVAPQQNYAPTIALHKRLITEYPDYRLIDGAYYLLGFCRQEMGDLKEGHQAFLSLVCNNQYLPFLEAANTDAANDGAKRGKQRKRRLWVLDEKSLKDREFDLQVYANCVPLRADSRFNTEAWVRVGEYHFDENELAPAIAAYTKVLNLGPDNNPYYDEALYKLAWTYYRADRYPDAIKNFDKLVTFADTQLSKTGRTGSEMRPEAVQYLAVSFAEQDWNGDTLPDTESPITRIEALYRNRAGEPHVRQVYQRLADILFDTTKYGEAIALYKLMLDRWPYDPNNPEIQDRVITALERDRQYDSVVVEREEFTRRFGQGTEWEQHNRNNSEALRKARQFDEQALIQAAIHHHRKGQELKKRGVALTDINLLTQAGQEYAAAALAYERYLRRFPESKNAYEIRYSYASALFYAQRFGEAAVVFAEVRDSNLDGRYREESAFSVAKSYEELIQTLVRGQELTVPELPDPAKAPATVSPQNIPSVFQNWQSALDTYVQLLPDDPKTPRLAYKSAEISYRYMHFDDARPRLTTIYQSYCENSVATQAGQALLVTYQLDKNLDKMEEWATALQSGKCGGEQVATGAQRILEGIKFKRANALMSDAEHAEEAGDHARAVSLYDQAAVAFLNLVDASPESADADKALNNAAVAYEKSQRYESATTVYERIWQQYPDSAFVDEALWRSAVNHRKFFSFDKAVQNFLILADSPKFSSSTYRNDAIFNAAVILENDQSYRRAAELLERYATNSKDADAGARAFFRAGTIYEKMKDDRAAARVYQDFGKRYGGLTSQGRSVVEGYFRLGQMAQSRNEWTAAKDAYQRAILEFSRRDLKSGTAGSEYAAHAEFALAEHEVKEFLKLDISGPVEQIPKTQQTMATRATALKAQLERVWQYKRPQWTLAAMFLSGQIYEHFARAMASGYRNAPLPRRVKQLGQEAVDIYLTQLDEALEQQVSPIEERAKDLYLACVDRAKQFGVANEYTEDARRRLYAFDPINYPLLKQPKIEMVLD